MQGCHKTIHVPTDNAAKRSANRAFLPYYSEACTAEDMNSTRYQDTRENDNSISNNSHDSTSHAERQRGREWREVRCSATATANLPSLLLRACVSAQWRDNETARPRYHPQCGILCTSRKAWLNYLITSIINPLWWFSYSSNFYLLGCSRSHAWKTLTCLRLPSCLKRETSKLR
jgi:hypothetical protein